MAGFIAWKVLLTVKDVKGKCEAGFKVGDQIELIGDNIMKGQVKCVYALNAIWPLVRTVAFGGKIPEDSPLCTDKGTFMGCCPDPNNLVTFEIKRDGIYWRTPESCYTKETHSFVPMDEGKK